MAKLVTLRIGPGNFDRGFSVTLQVGEEGFRPSIGVDGQLPPNSEIVGYYQQWRSIYRSLGGISRLAKPQAQITNSSELIANCRHAAENLSTSLEAWLNSTEFSPIKERLLEKLNPSETIRVIIQTADLDLRRLPWHLWKFFDRYTNAEVALSSPNYEKVNKTYLSSNKKVKILAILGNSQEINIDADRKYLETVPGAEVTFLPEPQRKEINDRLWEQNWDILFFAGHSQTDKDVGRIYINSTDSLTIQDLRDGLRKTIAKGLQLAIFNSCDGLGLARQLEDLHIPQIIVMREPIPDNVAQEFLKYFLNAFSSGKSLYLAVREARERLRSDGFDDRAPGVTWLPIICQNLAATPLTWPIERKKFKLDYLHLVGASLAVVSLVTGAIVLTKSLNLTSKSPTDGSSEVTAGFKSYKNPSYGFRINYPANWEVQKIEDPATKEVVQFFPANENSGKSPQIKVIVRVEPLNKNMSLDEYKNSSKNEIKRFLPDGKIVESSEIVLAKQQGYQLVFSGKDERNNLLQKMEAVTLYKGKAYAIVYEAEIGKYPDAWNTVREMMKSFEIIESDL